MGLDFNKRGAIWTRTRKLLKKLWIEPKVSFHGRFVSLDDVESFPKPVQRPHPPIIVGGAPMLLQ